MGTIADPGARAGLEAICKQHVVEVPLHIYAKAYHSVAEARLKELLPKHAFNKRFVLAAALDGVDHEGEDTSEGASGMHCADVPITLTLLNL